MHKCQRQGPVYCICVLPEPSRGIDREDVVNKYLKNKIKKEEESKKVGESHYVRREREGGEGGNEEKRRGEEWNARKKEREGRMKMKKGKEGGKMCFGWRKWGQVGSVERWGSVWCGTGTAMGQSDHLGRVTQTSLWFQATHPEITSTRCPSCYSPVDVSSHCVVQHRAKTAAEAGRGRPSLLAGATGPAPLLRGCGPGCQHQRSQVRVARSAGMAGLSHSLPSNDPALLGKREGPGSQQPRVRTSSCQSQLLAAIWAGAVPVSQICLPFGKRGENSVLRR